MLGVYLVRESMKQPEPEKNNSEREMQNVHKILVIKPEGGPLHALGVEEQ